MCGVFAIYGHPEAASLCYLGLRALQHRGQESAGIVSVDASGAHTHRAMGLVCDAFSQRTLAGLPGNRAIGHVRYSTSGESHIRNAQPFAADYCLGSIAVAHNGNLTNAAALRERLEATGSVFQSSSDTEVLVHLVATSLKTTALDRIVDALSHTQGAYCLVLLAGDCLYAVRDPMGFRPLVLGELRHAPANKPVWVVASELSSLELVGAKLLREIEPGEMLCIDESGCRSVFPFKPEPQRLCVFEYIYFARPDAVIDGMSVYGVRKALGARLAQEAPANADLVLPVPDSGLVAAAGFAQALRIPMELGLMRRADVGRTFIEPMPLVRHFGVRSKFSAVSAAIRGKRVVLVDDSIVRGTTMRQVVAMVRDAGAKSVDVRISSPPIAWPCYYGIDTPTRRELMASTHGVEQIRELLQADSLAFLSREGLASSLGDAASARATPGEQRTCDACFTGIYPVAVEANAARKTLAAGDCVCLHSN